MSASPTELATAGSDWVSVGKLSDIPVLGSRRVFIDRKRIALFRTRADKVFALRDQCPHEGGPLSDGIVHGSCVTCPLHNWVISLESGQAQGADSGKTQTYQVRVQGDELLLQTVPETAVDFPPAAADIATVSPP
ncbi:MAG: nitrite reductase small subunit NirD [Granulosicoccus sp.]